MLLGKGDDADGLGFRVEGLGFLGFRAYRVYRV